MLHPGQCPLFSACTVNITSNNLKSGNILTVSFDPVKNPGERLTFIWCALSLSSGASGKVTFLWGSGEVFWTVYLTSTDQIVPDWLKVILRGEVEITVRLGITLPPPLAGVSTAALQPRYLGP